MNPWSERASVPASCDIDTSAFGRANRVAAVTSGPGELHDGLLAVLRIVQAKGIGATIRSTEGRLRGTTKAALAHETALTDDLLRGAMALTMATSDLYALVHAAGILVAIRYLLDPDEVIESLSLGAGATGQPDLVTDRRVAEFKFQRWKGQSDGARQRELVADVLRLATDDSGKSRELYLLDKTIPERWLGSNRRNLTSLLGSTRHASLLDRATRRFGPVVTVAELWARIEPAITVVSLVDLAPEFADPDLELAPTSNFEEEMG